MLRPSDGPPGIGLYVQQADLAHPLQVGAHGVRVQVQRLGDLRRRQGPRRPRQLQVDRVARVLAQRLEDGEPGSSNRGSRASGECVLGHPPECTGGRISPAPFHRRPPVESRKWLRHCPPPPTCWRRCAASSIPSWAATSSTWAWPGRPTSSPTAPWTSRSRSPPPAVLSGRSSSTTWWPASGPCPA